MTHRLLIGWLFLITLSGCKRSAPPLDYELVAVHPHDAACYTQGLEFYGERLLESGGGYGESVLRLVSPDTGKVLREREIPERLFAEGITVLNGELWMLTWQENKAMVFDPETFEYKRSHAYQGEGWGLTNDGEALIMSDGSDVIEFRKPSDFSVVRSLRVTEKGKSLVDLNELEFVKGDIYANVYTENRIVRISAKTGEVEGSLDLTKLSRRHRQIDASELEVLNGIAYHPGTGHFWVTGKNWSEMFELKLSGR